MKIKMTGIPVKSPEDAHKFYTEILGFSSMMFMPEHHLAIVSSPEQPNGSVLLLEPTINPISLNYQEALYAQGIPVIVLGSDDVEAEHAKLSAKGVVFKKEPTKTEWGIIATFDDSCGNYVQIHQDLPA